MDRKQLKKNKLDLEYHKYSQILNSLLIFSTTGLLAFLGSFVFLENKNKLALGLSISAIMLIIAIGTYKKINKKLESIIAEIENLIS